jgi:3-hydroxybutyryl-CoA dehydrogenase
LEDEAVTPRKAASDYRPAGVLSGEGRTACAAGVVGMGLMGVSISACLLAAGHSLHSIESNPARLRTARGRLSKLLKDAQAEGVITATPATLLQRFTVSDEISDLKDAEIVIESTVEDLAVKRQVISDIEQVVSGKTLIGCNTSAIPVTDLQSNTRHPERILGLHWAEPAHLTRFMEIICGRHTTTSNAQRAMRLARKWGKEPSLLRKDIRGFITNRIMYAMLREAFYLVDSGFASVADVDRSLRNDLGYWITFAGPFRFMDLTGIPAYATVMKELLPELNCATEVPRLMQRVVNSGARGVSNAKGFYRYTPSQAKRWEELFMEFSYEIRGLAGKYPENAGDRENSNKVVGKRVPFTS